MAGSWWYSSPVRENAAAQEIDDAAEFRARRRKQCGIGAVGPFQRVGEMIGAVGDEYMVVVEEGAQPQPDEMMDPVAIEIVVQLIDDIVRGGDIFEFAQHAVAAVGDRIGQEQALLLQFNVVRAPGRGEHRDDDADDRKRDHDADRNRHRSCADARRHSACGTFQTASKPSATRANPQGLTYQLRGTIRG